MENNILMKNRHKNKVEYRHRFFIVFRLIFGPILEPKSCQNSFQRGFGRAFDEDHVLKLKKTPAESIAGAQTGGF